LSYLLDLCVELYKRKEYAKIPIGCYPSGELFYPTDKQVRTLNLLNDEDTSHVGYGGSARSGKSIIECVAIILDCHAYKGIAWGLGRLELTRLKRTVLITLFNQFDFYQITENEFNYNQQLNKITFNNGSEIFLIDTQAKPSDPLNTRFNGYELTRCALDESNENNLSVINKLYERCGWRKNLDYGIKAKLLETFNPDKNHVHTRYWLPFRDKKEDDYKKFIQALPSDNPHPSVKIWIANLIKTGDTPTIERQVHGNFDFDDDPNSLCDWDAIQDLFTNDHIPEIGKKRISADLAMQGRDKFIAGSSVGNVVRISLDIAKATGRGIEMALKQLKQSKGVPNSQIVADIDGLGNYLESYITNIKAFRGGGSAWNRNDFANIKSECAWKLSELINKRELFIICTKEQEEEIKKEISTCLKGDSLDVSDGKKKLISKEKMKGLLGRSPDYMDMLIMLMIFWVKKTSLKIDIS